MRARMMAGGLAVLAFLGTAGVTRAVTIADLLASPDSYDGSTVTVAGTVAVSVPVASESGYDLRDGVSAITVISRSAAPAAGAHLSVTGKIHVFHDGDGGTESIAFPPVLAESSRAPAP